MNTGMDGAAQFQLAGISVVPDCQNYPYFLSELKIRISMLASAFLFRMGPHYYRYIFNVCGAREQYYIGSSSIRFVIIIFLEMIFHQHLTELLSKSLLALLIIIIQSDWQCSPSPNIVHIITMIIIISILLLL